MRTYIVRGYSSSNPDFTDTIVLPDDCNLTSLHCADMRYSATYTALKAELLNTGIGSDVLDSLDIDDFETREDLADYDGQIVIIVSILCDQTVDCDCDGMGQCDGCASEDCMLTFDPQ